VGPVVGWEVESEGCAVSPGTDPSASRGIVSTGSSGAALGVGVSNSAFGTDVAFMLSAVGTVVALPSNVALPSRVALPFVPLYASVAFGAIVLLPSVLLLVSVALVGIGVTGGRVVDAFVGLTVGGRGAGVAGAGVRGAGVLGAGVRGAGVLGAGVLGAGVLGAGVRGTGTAFGTVGTMGQWVMRHVSRPICRRM